MLWDKGEEVSDEFLKFTIGDDRALDQRLFKYDCLASAAHAQMLYEVGLLEKEEAEKLEKKLLELKDSNVLIPENFEDGHSYLEFLLIESLGDIGAKIHLGRSRNDQVIVALRLYMLNELRNFLQKVHEGARCFYQRSKEEILIPGYTHQKPAMPTTSGVWFGAFGEGLLEVLEDGAYLLEALNKNPLGSASGFNSGLPLDKELTAKMLGFSRIQRNPIDVQGSRGRHEAKLLQLFSTFSLIISKFAWDTVLFCGSGLVDLDKRITSGSSLMPQKRNPDLFEIIRARAAQLRGIQGEMFLVVGSLPSSYHRDFQETKGIFIRGVDLALSLAKILPLAVNGIRFNEEFIKGLPEIYATYQAFEKVKAGTPFRLAYKEVAKEVETTQPDPEKFKSYILRIKKDQRESAENLGQELENIWKKII